MWNHCGPVSYHLRDLPGNVAAPGTDRAHAGLGRVVARAGLMLRLRSSYAGSRDSPMRCNRNFLVACLLAISAPALGGSPGSGDWPAVGNDPGCMRYSGLDQINRNNVMRLKP